MVTNPARLDWQYSQDALRDEVQRVITLLRSIRGPKGDPVVGGRGLTEVALHLSQAWVAVPGLARRDLSGVFEVIPQRAGRAGGSLVRDVADLGEMTTRAVRSDPERDLGVLADRIDARAQEYFADCAGQSPDELRPWLIDGITVPGHDD
ncbi:MAG: hypothetical protein M3Y48_11120 [Actinomycetota bacterium]|nr:hypothetical protein [Actinomycetota bacterium]